MPTPILMPALSPTMEEGKLAKWLVKEGDEVAPGDVIAEIETDKATMEVEAVDEGRVGRILVEEGTEGVKVNAPIAVLLAEGEDESAISDAMTQVPSATDGGQSAAAEEKPKPAAEPQPAPPAPAAAAKETPTPTQDRREPRAAPQPAEVRDRVFASPLARRLALQEGLDLTRVTGSGPRGRIVKRDIEKAIEAGVAAAPAVAAPAAAAPTDQQILALYEEGTYEVRPHDSMRRVIAERLVQAKQTIPHFYLTVDCHVDPLLAMRARLNERAPQGDDGPAFKLSVNDFLIKALAAALQQVPEANATWTEGGMLIHRHFTPVVRKAETKGLAEISNEMKDLASRARKRRLAPHEYQGGTTAISNLGMYGIRDFSAVINPPHATILAVGAAERRPVVVDDAVTIRTMMTATLSCDHRVVDGVLGARLLDAFKAIVEEPGLMLL